jgi:predicted dithiol-disulfide oxidoreductase (DUF899 family)
VEHLKLSIARHFRLQLDALRARKRAHTHEGDAIAAASRRLSMVKVGAAAPLVGERGTVTLLEAFEGRRSFIAYYLMWYNGKPCAGAMRGVHLGYIAGPRAVLYSFSRRHLCPFFARLPTKRARGVDVGFVHV